MKLVGSLPLVEESRTAIACPCTTLFVLLNLLSPVARNVLRSFCSTKLLDNNLLSLLFLADMTRLITISVGSTLEFDLSTLSFTFPVLTLMIELWMGSWLKRLGAALTDMGEANWSLLKLREMSCADQLFFSIFWRLTLFFLKAAGCCLDLLCRWRAQLTLLSKCRFS